MVSPNRWTTKWEKQGAFRRKSDMSREAMKEAVSSYGVEFRCVHRKRFKVVVEICFGPVARSSVGGEAQRVAVNNRQGDARCWGRETAAGEEEAGTDAKIETICG